MIITVSSAPIVDTSSVINELSIKHGLEILEDPLRDICKQHGFQTIYDMPHDLQKYIRLQMIKSHHDYISQNNDILLNYSVVEWLADWIRWFWNSTPTQLWSETIELAKACVREYDYIYHVENKSRKSYNGYVWLDKMNSKQINSIIKYLYIELDIAARVYYMADDN